MNFLEFKTSKYTLQPYDWDHNPFRFRYPNLKVPNADNRLHSSDTSAHLPLLEFLASLCSHVTEFGFRQGFSASAFIAGCPGKVVSYDIQTYNEVSVLKNMDLPCEWEFRRANTIDPNLEIAETDLLYIDTLHTYDQVKQELSLHVGKVRRFLVFHDTYSHGEMSLDVPGEIGITKAINEFLDNNPEWHKVYEVTFNHGLTVLEKK